MSENTRAFRKTRIGQVVSDKMDKTIVVAIEDSVQHPLYKKILKRTYKLKAHDENNECGTGDTVEVMETLTRAEVSGGGKKPWRQKGTGRARQGSTRAPQWTHGGIVFAPKPRDYSYTLNKKVKRLALKSVLSAKAASQDIVVIDSIKMNEIKTKEFAKFLSAVNAESKPLVVTAEPDTNVVRSGRNIPGCEITFANLINVYDILNAKKLVLDQAALAKIEEVFA